ncbi:MAG: bactofilin family protein [Bacillota bacterium]
MFKKNVGYRDGLDSLIGINSEFKGNIETDGSIRVDGKLIGDARVTGDIYIGEQAIVKGNIEGSNINLAGTIEGNIIARGILKILSSAKLYGDIKVNRFVADEGALFQGKCEMLEISAVEPVAEKNHGKNRRNYKKSNVLEDIYEENN